LNGVSVKINCLAIVLILIAAGCTREADVAHHTVEDYRANKTLRQETFKKCTNDPGTLSKTTDCINAQEAERLESYGSLRSSGPVGLDSKRKP
jgi:hypothetical protein